MSGYRALAILPLVWLCLACQGEDPRTPTQPTPNPPGPVRRTIALGEVVEITLDAFLGPGWYCGDIGDDPSHAPCAFFVADVPRPGILAIRMEFETSHPMFVTISDVTGHQVPTSISDRSPIVVRKAVGRGAVRFEAGLAVSGGLADGQVRFSLVTSLQ